MPEIKGISFFGTAAEIVANTLLFISNPDTSATSGYSTFSTSASELALAILDTFEYTTELSTTDKTIIGAINEIAQGGGGGSVLYGTTAPTAQQGTNGSLYIQYSGSAQQANLAIVAFYGKIENTWLSIATGGGISLDVIGEEYDPTATYNIGDYCLHDNKLYVCTTDGTTGAWSVSHWDETNVAYELKLHKNDFDDLPVVTMPYTPIATFNTDRAVPVDMTCEIGSTGASAVNITQTGKNIYPIKVGRDNWTNNRNATHTDNADILSITTASETDSGVYARTTSPSTLLDTIIAHNVNVTISLYAKASAANSDFFFGFQTIGGTTATLTTDWQKVIIPIYNYYGLTPIMTFYNRSSASITVDIKDVQIEIGEATDYEAYKTSTRTISIGETVYEGSVNITEGGSVTYDDGQGSTTALSPITPITPYIGTNNIWADTGDTSVAYRESAQKYIDENTGLSRAKVYSLNLSQGGAWINTGVDMTSVDTLMFERDDNSDVNLQVVIKKSQIAVYTGGSDVYTTIYAQGGKPLNVRIYNNVLYASYNGTGAATYVTNVYALKDVF